MDLFKQMNQLTQRDVANPCTEWLNEVPEIPLSEPPAILNEHSVCQISQSLCVNSGLCNALFQDLQSYQNKSQFNGSKAPQNRVPVIKLESRQAQPQEACQIRLTCQVATKCNHNKVPLQDTKSNFPLKASDPGCYLLKIVAFGPCVSFKQL